MKDVAEVAFDAASGADVFGEALGINQVIQLGEIVSLRQNRNEERGMRNGRFADGETRMLFGIDQNYADALLAQDRGQQGTGETVAKNGDIKVMFCFLYYHRITPQRLVLDQGRPPGETGAVGREHDEIAIFDPPSFDRIDIADDHVGFLQMAVVHAPHGEFFGRNPEGFAESFQVPGGEGGIDEEGDILHLLTDLLEDAEHDLRNMKRFIGISSLLNLWMSPHTWSQRGYLPPMSSGLRL